MELQPHQQRVVTEKQELDEKLGKLLSFFVSPIFAGLPEAERSRLRNQARFMDGYSAVLGERVEAFSAAPDPAHEVKQYANGTVASGPAPLPDQPPA